jgi:transglycosylase-like protein with SLT domain/sporulation related protein
MRSIAILILAWGFCLAPSLSQTHAEDAPAPEIDADPRCQALQSAAQGNDLPLEFFTRLIWQESRFNDLAVSRAGAQGIAQFMPATAADVNLANPFDAIAAIDKSAQLLRGLRMQFGNLGLAAAAYNAGPKRVSDWLTGRRVLPQETVHYVRIITGHAPDEWRTPQSSATNLSLPIAVPCPQIVKLFSADRIVTAHAPRKPGEPASSPPRPSWGVQLVGNSSEFAALAAFYKLRKTYASVLGSHEPLVLRTSAGRNASWYRIRVGADTRNEAQRLCSNLRAAGGSCLVQMN